MLLYKCMHVILYVIYKMRNISCKQSSVADPWHFGVDPDPAIFFIDLRCQQKTIFFQQSCPADYFLKLDFSNMAKRSHKPVGIIYNYYICSPPPPPPPGTPEEKRNANIDPDTCKCIRWNCAEECAFSANPSFLNRQRKAGWFSRLLQNWFWFWNKLCANGDRDMPSALFLKKCSRCTFPSK